MAARNDVGPVPVAVDIPEAVALMVGQAVDEPVEAVDSAHPIPEEDIDSTGEVVSDDVGIEATDGAPDFWRPEDKPLWKDVPGALRPVLEKYERERMAFLHEKTRDATKSRNEAIKAAQEAS